MPFLARLAHALLALWIGAVACTALVVAPNVFGILDDRTLAGDVMQPIFRMVDAFGVVAALVFVAAARRHAARAGTALGLGVLAAVNLLVLAPRIAQRTEGFETLHALSTALWMAILIGGLALVWFGPRPVVRAD